MTNNFPTPTNPTRVVIAGSSGYTKLMATTLLDDPNFNLTHILTPAPKPQGRKQKLIPNPLHQFALDQQLPVTLINQKVDQQLKQQLEELVIPDILLVVDFGYLVPGWLLDWPKTAPVNIHPSKLPAWRGSSPGQMTLLHGETQSSLTIMQMNTGLDQGPIYFQTDFTVNLNWNSQDYYDFAFQLASQNLNKVLTKISTGELKAAVQPKKSPTPISQRLKKIDGFINWNQLYPLLTSTQQTFLPAKNPELSVTQVNTTGLLNKLFGQTPKDGQAALLERANRAFSPWPKLWTMVNTKQGIKRLKIEKLQLINDRQLKLQLVQLEGKQITKPEEIKNWFEA